MDNGEYKGSLPKFRGHPPKSAPRRRGTQAWEPQDGELKSIRPVACTQPAFSHSYLSGTLLSICIPAFGPSLPLL